jgi:hypothetical protein
MFKIKKVLGSIPCPGNGFSLDLFHLSEFVKLFFFTMDNSIRFLQETGQVRAKRARQDKTGKSQSKLDIGGQSGRAKYGKVGQIGW